jgi:hypothetical protein
MRHQIVEMALRELNRLILNEVEYPTAFDRLFTGLELSSAEGDELQRLYDEQGWAR